VLLDTGVYLLQTTISSGAKMAVFIFPPQSPISGWALTIKWHHIHIKYARLYYSCRPSNRCL